MGMDDEIAGTKASTKSPKPNDGTHILEVTGACQFKSDSEREQQTYVVEFIEIEHTPRAGLMPDKQATGTILGWPQVADKNRKPAIKAFAVAGAKGLAIALGKDPDLVKEESVTGEAITAMFPKGNENKGKSILRGMRFSCDSTWKKSEKGNWPLCIYQPVKEQPSYAASQEKAKKGE